MSEPGGRFRPSEGLPLAEGLWPGWTLCPLMGKQEEGASCCTGAQMGAGGLGTARRLTVLQCTPPVFNHGSGSAI